MNPEAPITWLIGVINLAIDGAVQNAYQAIATKISPVVAVAFGIYLWLVAMNYLRGAGAEDVVDASKRMIAFALIIGLGMNAANYGAIVVPMVRGIGPDLANAVGGGDASANELDQLALHYVKILSDGYDRANSPMFPMNLGPMALYMIKSALVLLGLVPFLVACTLAYVAADVGAQLVVAVGPIYFAFLLFPATRQWFSAWLNSALSFALVPLLVSVIAGMSLTISKQAFGDGTNLTDISLTSVFLGSIVNLVLLYLVYQANSLASSLSAGGASFATVGGVGATAAKMRTSVVGTAREVAPVYRAAKKRWDERQSNKIKKVS